MASFLASPLRALDRIYRFVNDVAPRSMELGLPVQLVHNVAREAELGGPNMGLFISGQDNVHVGAGTIEASFDPYTEVAYLYPNVTDTWVWLIAAWGTLSTPAGFATASLAVGYVPVGEQIVRRDRLIVAWDSSAPIYDQNVSPATLANGLLPVTKAAAAKYPVIIPPGATMRIQSVTGGALTCRIEGLFWAGPVGIEPPQAG